MFYKFLLLTFLYISSRCIDGTQFGYSKNFDSNYGNNENSDTYTCIGNCKKLDFIVNFTEIGWEKWIIHPQTYNAYYCSGQCPTPLTLQNIYNDDGDDDTSPQVTNHAQMMSVLEFLDPIHNTKMTQCVPTKLEPLEILTVNDVGEIEIRKYENMIVKQCGCR